MESDEHSFRHGSAGAIPPFRVHPSPCGFQPGINLLKLNELIDEIEIDDAATEGRE
jgi:hypothetical protein